MMMRYAAALLALMLLPSGLALAEAATDPAGAAELSGQFVAEAASPSAQAPAGAAELSGYYGQDIAQAAAAIGGLTYTPGEEYRDNYDGEALSLRGEGTVSLIDLRAGDAWALCGITVGMKRDEALGLLSGYDRMWEYDEEIAFNVVPDAEKPAASQILVVFFDEGGLVSGAWYRAAGE